MTISGVTTEIASAHHLAGLLRVGPGFRLADVGPRSRPGFDGGKSEGEHALEEGVDELSRLQEKLFAQARGASSDRAVLLVLQGMDTSGKGGIMRHVVGAVDPQGVTHHAFKAPTEEERRHDFLWRIRRQLPAAGMVGVFDRSHYEDVLIVRVHDLVPPAEWQGRYEVIDDFEREVTAAGTTLVKVMLHISPEEQKRRLMERLERPDKHWKYNPGDVDERGYWAQYQAAYQEALTRCSPGRAPWYVVPADRKWYARWAVQQLLLRALREIDPQWPSATYDVAAEKARLQESPDTF